MACLRGCQPGRPAVSKLLEGGERHEGRSGLCERQGAIVRHGLLVYGFEFVGLQAMPGHHHVTVVLLPPILIDMASAAGCATVAGQLLLATEPEPACFIRQSKNSASGSFCSQHNHLGLSSNAI